MRTVKNNYFTDEYDAAEYFTKRYSRYILKYQVVGNKRLGEAGHNCVEIVIVPVGKSLNTLKKKIQSEFKIEPTGNIWSVQLGLIGMKIIVAECRNYHAAVFFYTGPVEFLDQVNRIAANRGLRISPDGVYRDDKPVKIWDEAKIFDLLGMKYLKPAERGKNSPQINTDQGKKLKIMEDENAKEN